MNVQMYKIAFSLYMRRVVRTSPVGLAIFTALPLGITLILSYIYSHNTDQVIIVGGYNMITTHISIGMMLMFQLNSGLYLLDYVDRDFEKPMKWRMKSLPCPAHIFTFTATAACTVFTVMQGLLIVGVSAFLMKAYWGSYFITVIVILLISLISQSIIVILFLLLKKVSSTETVSWIMTWSMAALGGLMFELPQNRFFEFMKQYGTPFSLAQTAIKASGTLNPSYYAVGISIGSLIIITLLLGLSVILLGRRRIS